MNANRNARRLVAMVASAALMGGAGAFATGSIATASSDRVTATAGVNVRSGPGTGYDVMGGLYPGYVVAVRGPARQGWTPVTYNGREAWVSTKYLRKVGTAVTTQAPPTAATRTIRTTTALNIRTGPGTTYKIIKVLVRSSLVSTTGKTKNGFSEITYAGALRWVSTQYLKASEPTAATTGVATRYATTVLDIRSVSSTKYAKLGEIPRGAKVSITGVQQSGRAQIIWGKSTAWVTAQYLSSTTVSSGSGAGASAGSGKATPSLPKITGTRYATTLLMIRSSPEATFTDLGDVTRGTALSITGASRNGRAQIIYKGAARWVTAQYLSSSRPRSAPSSPASPTSPTGPTNSINGSGLTNLKPNTKALLNKIRIAYPQFRTFYGVRPDSIPDHPSGRALDSMLPGDYRSTSSQASGKALAEWAKNNARALHIEYIIYDQQIWNINRASEGWRYMANRGSDNANHKNHVHITVYN